MIKSKYIDDETINIAGFLALTLSFSFVELFYGRHTNSIGLISDSFHMFFDCTALIVGLLASILKNKPSNTTYTYGYDRADAVCGIINGVILVLTSVILIKESFERLHDPPTIKQSYLLLISFLGCIVNFIGILIFHHGGSHLNSCPNDHDHNDFTLSMHKGNEDTHIFIPFKNSSDTVEPFQPFNLGEGLSQTKDISQSIISHGIYLHILADALGSISVILSSFLVSKYEYMWADPLCCLLISFIIIGSSYNLLKDSIKILMQGIPEHLVESSSNALKMISQLNYGIDIAKANFWSLSKKKHIATIKLYTHSNEYANILADVNRILYNAGFTETTVQIEPMPL